MLRPCLLAFALAGCDSLTLVIDGSVDGPSDFSLAGLSYDNGTDSFSGLPLTDLVDMPSGASANATYVGEYRSEDGDGRNGSGRAELDLDFVAATADLSLTGAVTATLPGVIDATDVKSTATSGSTFKGDFYGTTGNVVAGEFELDRILPEDDVIGRFIVGR